jgi:hypothetical protein
MIQSVHPRHISQISRVDPVKDRNIDTVLGGIRPALMMVVNPAGPTKPVFRCFAAPLIEGQVLCALHNFHIPQQSRDNNRPPPRTIGTITTPCRFHPVQQGHLVDHRPTMTRPPYLRVTRGMVEMLVAGLLGAPPLDVQNARPPLARQTG